MTDQPSTPPKDDNWTDEDWRLVIAAMLDCDEEDAIGWEEGRDASLEE